MRASRSGRSVLHRLWLEVRVVTMRQYVTWSIGVPFGIIVALAFALVTAITS
jgi:hypothetical protein